MGSTTVLLGRGEFMRLKVAEPSRLFPGSTCDSHVAGGALADRILFLPVARNPWTENLT
jgi:hypothetical protein